MTLRKSKPAVLTCLTLVKRSSKVSLISKKVDGMKMSKLRLSLPWLLSRSLTLSNIVRVWTMISLPSRIGHLSSYTLPSFLPLWPLTSRFTVRSSRPMSLKWRPTSKASYGSKQVLTWPIWWLLPSVHPNLTILWYIKPKTVSWPRLSSLEVSFMGYQAVLICLSLSPATPAANRLSQMPKKSLVTLKVTILCMHSSLSGHLLKKSAKQ